MPGSSLKKQGDGRLPVPKLKSNAPRPRKAARGKQRCAPQTGELDADAFWTGTAAPEIWTLRA